MSYLPAKQRAGEVKKARQFWASLDFGSRWELGDQLVLGEFDWRDWLPKSPTKEFMAEVKNQRLWWEQLQP